MFPRFRKYMQDNGHTQNELAEILGRSYQSISLKLNGKQEFTLREIFIIVHGFGLTAQQVYDMFFDPSQRYNFNSEEKAL